MQSNVIISIDDNVAMLHWQCCHAAAPIWCPKGVEIGSFCFQLGHRNGKGDCCDVLLGKRYQVWLSKCPVREGQLRALLQLDVCA